MSSFVALRPSFNSAAPQGVYGTPSVAILSTYAPTRCGLAMFSASLAQGLEAVGAEVSVVRISDGSPTPDPRVIGELENGNSKSVAACAELLNQSDVAVIQYQDGAFAGLDGSEVLDVLAALHVPPIVIVHTVSENPTTHQRATLEAIGARSDQLIVMSQAARRQLLDGYQVERAKVHVVPHGATAFRGVSAARRGRPTLLTWGLMEPSKGIGRVIDVMDTLTALPGRPRYLVAGRTHPKVLAADGESYRQAWIEQAQRNGLTDSVEFDDRYRSRATLSELVQSAAVIVLPYDSTDQVTSGVLVDAIASGRPIVATAFPHAVEVLASGAGIVVGHDDSDALASALHRVLTQPRLAGSMAAEARRLAPEMAWSVVAGAYLQLARQALRRRHVRT